LRDHSAIAELLVELWAVKVCRIILSNDDHDDDSDNNDNDNVAGCVFIEPLAI